MIFRSGSRPPSKKELALITLHLGTMLRAGLPLLTSLTALSKTCRSPALQSALNGIHSTIADGGSLAGGLRGFPRVFSPLYVAFISAGERAGILERTLEILARNLEASHTLKMRLRRAAIYPLIVILTLTVVTIFLMIWVVPIFYDLFSESNIALPWLTQCVIALSDLACKYWLLGLGLMAATPLITKSILRFYPALKSVPSEISLRTPFLKEAIPTKYAAELSTLFAALLGAGITVIDALEIISATVSNQKLALELLNARGQIIEGHSLAYCLQRIPTLPPLFIQMLEIGETSGDLEGMLSKSAQHFHHELENTLENLRHLAEPCLVLLVGVVVGTLVLAVYLPIFQIGDLASVR